MCVCAQNAFTIITDSDIFRKCFNYLFNLKLVALPSIYLFYFIIASSAALTHTLTRCGFFSSHFACIKFYFQRKLNSLCKLRFTIHTIHSSVGWLPGGKRWDKWSYFCHLLHWWKSFKWKQKKNSHTQLCVVCIESAKIIHRGRMDFVRFQLRVCIETSRTSITQLWPSRNWCECQTQNLIRLSFRKTSPK